MAEKHVVDVPSFGHDRTGQTRGAARHQPQIIFGFTPEILIHQKVAVVDPVGKIVDDYQLSFGPKFTMPLVVNGVMIDDNDIWVYSIDYCF